MKKFSALMLTIVILMLVLGGCALRKEEPQVKYMICCGLNDAEQNMQILNVEAAQLLARGVITSKGLGYTEYVTYGAYVENGKTNGNDTLIYELCFVDRTTAEEVAGDIKKKLNLTSVLLQEVECSYDFVA